MGIVVQKYGGSSLADADAIKRVARRIVDVKKAGHDVVVAVSAMGDTTDDLEEAALIVALKHAEHLPLLQERFPAWAEKVEFWQVDDAPEVLGLIEQEVMGLVARLLGGGQRRATVPLMFNLAMTKPIRLQEPLTGAIDLLGPPW